jgi:hypothetical protein
MRKLIVSEFITLDGVIQAPGGPDEDRDGGFAHGGWTLPYWHDDIGKTFLAFMKDADALLLGWRTYVTHAEAFEPGSRRHSTVREKPPAAKMSASAVARRPSGNTSAPSSSTSFT